jgi:hypothetical protein
MSFHPNWHFDNFWGSEFEDEDAVCPISPLGIYAFSKCMSISIERVID